MAREGYNHEQAADDLDKARYEAKPLARADLLEDRYHRRRPGELRGSGRDEGERQQDADDLVGNSFDSP